MSKKKTDLKAALQTLKVHEALRLQKSRPTQDFDFKRPELSDIKLSSAQTDQRAHPSEMKTSSDDQELGSVASERKSISAENELRLKPSEVKRSSDIPDSTGFDLSPFLKGRNEINLVEHGEGSFHIPHKIYEFVHKAVDTKVELLVFNCLLRYTLGFQRTTCKASQSFISRWTGIAAPNVRKALKSLIERRFIRRLEEGTISHDSAVYELPIVTAYLAYDRARKSEIENTSDQHDLGSKTSPNSDQIDSRTEINSIPKKERLNNKEKKTLSPEISDVLQSYFSGPLTDQKREREWIAFKSIQKQFTTEQIERAFLFLQSHGALENGSPVHSPMAYLSLSIGDVLTRVSKKDEASNRRLEEKQRQELENQARQKHEEREAEAFRQREKSFCEAFPNAEGQEEFIRKICGRQQFSWIPKGIVARNIAIQTWWDETHLQAQQP